jgi:hypothetical protein
MRSRPRLRFRLAHVTTTAARAFHTSRGRRRALAGERQGGEAEGGDVNGDADGDADGWLDSGAAAGLRGRGGAGWGYQRVRAVRRVSAGFLEIIRALAFGALLKP